MKRTIEMNVNGETYAVQVGPEEFLVDVLRGKLSLTGTKKACDMGVCGSCTVLLDGMPVSSCLILAVDTQGKAIQTIEGMGARSGALHPIQESFLEKGAIQCGFCTPGMVMTAKAFLERNPNPSEHEIRKALAGNICRCTGYFKIVEAVKDAADRSVGE